MTNLIHEGDAIEGDVVDGHSRKPLASMGMFRLPSGQKYYRFVARFNAHASVSLAGAGPSVFFPNASNVTGDTIMGENIVIHSFDGKPASQLAHQSAAHRATAWHFTKRTGARIAMVYQQLVNGHAARLSRG